MTNADQAPQNADARSPQQARLLRDFAEFEDYLFRAKSALAKGELATASAYCAIASHVATQNHCGIFWSPRVEAVLVEIGKQIEPSGQADWRRHEFRNVLQVCTQVSAVGGHTKMLCQWVDADKTRQHSLVLTQHRGLVPDFVKETFDRSGGTFEQLNQHPGGQLDWAKRLRKIAREHDLVILHTHCEDTLPVLAFAETEKFPPVLVLNHADHIYWVGPSVCHLSINLRDAAQDLAIGRRGIAPERNILMPTLAEAVKRTRTREEAKRDLGISEDTVLLVSAARSAKYRTMRGVSFAEIHRPVLEQHPNAKLIVVGAGDPEDWKAARDAVGADRLIALPEQPNPKLYFEAADIYVDSYPFVSSTSMMEAAGYGLPMATIFTAPQEARIFGINHVALVGTAMQAASFDEYQHILSTLIEDPELRASKGQAGQDAVREAHNAPGWMDYLNAVYARAAALPPLDNTKMLRAVEQPHLGPPDTLHQEIFGGGHPTQRVLMSYMGMLPLPQHMTLWNQMRRAGAYHSASEAVSFMVPEWVKRFMKDHVLKLSDRITFAR